MLISFYKYKFTKKTWLFTGGRPKAMISFPVVALLEVQANQWLFCINSK